MITGLSYIMFSAATAFFILSCWIAWLAHKSWQAAEASWRKAEAEWNDAQEAELDRVKWRDHYRFLSSTYDLKLKELEDKEKTNE